MYRPSHIFIYIYIHLYIHTFFNIYFVFLVVRLLFGFSLNQYLSMWIVLSCYGVLIRSQCKVPWFRHLQSFFCSVPQVNKKSKDDSPGCPSRWLLQSGSARISKDMVVSIIMGVPNSWMGYKSYNGKSVSNDLGSTGWFST